LLRLSVSICCWDHLLESTDEIIRRVHLLRSTVEIICLDQLLIHSPSRRSTPHNANKGIHVIMEGDRSIFVLRGASNAKKSTGNAAADLFWGIEKHWTWGKYGICIVG
jgi:hypothetical protein